MKGFRVGLRALLRHPRRGQWLRRLLQMSVVLLIVYSALGGPWRNFKLAHNNSRLVGLIQGPVWGTLYGLNEDLLSLFGDSAEASLGVLGFPWSARVLGLDTVDPILVFAHAAATRHTDLRLLAAVTVPLLLALLLGRVFCSHLCPMRLLFEIGEATRHGLHRLGFELPAWRPRETWGGWVLLGGLVATVSSGVGVWLLILPYTSLGASVFVFVGTGALSGLSAVVLGWWLVDVLVAPGLFCRNLCPTGFLLGQVGRWSLLRVEERRAVDPCPSSCDLCSRSCPYGLDPSRGMHHPACDRCGRCSAVCPGQRLVRRIGPVAMTALAVVLLSPAVGRAHHNKGLPHYGYYENYPQVPTEEYIDFSGRWEIGATFFNFQGYDRRAADTPHDVKIFLYLYDLEKDQPYTGSLAVEIRRRGEVVSRFDRLVVDEESVYSTRETLPETGTYELAAFVEGSTEPVILAFYVDLSPGRVRWGWIAGFGIPVLVVFALAVIGKRRRSRRRFVIRSAMGGAR